MKHEEVGSGASFCRSTSDTTRIRSTPLAHDLPRKKKKEKKKVGAMGDIEHAAEYLPMCTLI